MKCRHLGTRRSSSIANRFARVAPHNAATVADLLGARGHCLSHRRQAPSRRWTRIIRRNILQGAADRPHVAVEHHVRVA